MELKEFISKALLSIVNGVSEANSEIDCFELSGSVHHGKDVNGTKVDFDLSVVAEKLNESGTDKEGGLKIQILSAGINSQEKEMMKNQSVQRMQFSVFINEETILKNKKTPL